MIIYFNINIIANNKTIFMDNKKSNNNNNNAIRHKIQIKRCCVPIIIIIITKLYISVYNFTLNVSNKKMLKIIVKRRIELKSRCARLSSI